MKRALKQMLGVTLLEIMLVLAVAAFIVVMSIRYYQSAQTGVAVQEIEGAITALSAAADNIALTTGTYSGILASSLAGAAYPNGITTPWGNLNAASTQFSGSSSGYTATITGLNKMPASGACPQIIAFIGNEFKGHLAQPATCSGGQISWQYTN